MAMQKNVKLAGDFIRFQYYPHLLLMVVFCLVSGFFVSFRNLPLWQSARVMEMYVIFVGVILLTPLFMGEQNKEIWGLEQTKKTSMWILYLLRVLLALIVIAACITIFLFVLKNANSEVNFETMWLGSFSEIIFLGGIGFFVSAVTNQVVLGYMASVMYYAMNIGKSDSFGKFALFQMAKGNFEFAGWMIIAVIVMIVLGIGFREVMSRH